MARAKIILWALPVCFVALMAVMLAVSLPFWQVFNLDPDYYYLMSGLRLVEGLPPTDLSHPGTPVQVAVALVLRLMHPTLPADQVVRAVLADPEHHLLVATLALYPPVALALVWLGRAVMGATGALWPALLAQGSPFLSMIIPKFSLHPKPEPLLIVATCLLVVACLRAVRRGPADSGAAIRAGLVMGFGIAVKLQFVALGVVPLFLFDRRRLFLVYPAASVAAFLVSTLPAWPSAGLFVDYWTRVITHAGPFGAGAAQVVDTSRYGHTVVKIFGSKILFSLTIVATLVLLAAYARARRRGAIAADRTSRLAAGMILGQLATVVLIAKQSAAHYLIPALMLTGPTLAVLWHLSRPWRGSPAVHRRAWAVVSAVLVALSVPASVSQTRELARWTREAQAFDMGRFAGCAKIYFDAASAPSYALLRGDMNAAGRYSPLLAPTMPADEYTWFTNDHTWWSHGLRWWDRPETLAAIVARHGCAVFRGSQDGTLHGRVQAEWPGFVYDDRCHTGEEAIFTKGVTCDGRALR